MTSSKRNRKKRRASSTILTNQNKEKRRKIDGAGSLAKDLILLSILSTLCVTLGAAAEALSACQRSWALRKKRREEALARNTSERRSWSKEDERISDRMFYRLFRMTRPSFRKLCVKIEGAVGPSKFKSEAYLDNLKKIGHTTRESSMYNASLKTSGGWISGEVKLAMTLRILAGASYLDMFLWFNVNPDNVCKFFREVVRDWICNEKVISINYFDDVLENDEAIDRIRSNFAVKSGGVMRGCIGAVDGWLVKIKCPRLDEVDNPGKYFSRKGSNT